MINDNKNTSVTQTSIFGLLVGLSFIAVSLFFYNSGKNINSNLQLNNVIMLLSISGAFVGIRKYREDHLNGIISYGKALGACVYLISVASLTYGVYIYFLYNYTPELKENYIEIAQLTLATAYEGSPLLESLQTITQAYINSASIAFTEIFNKIFIGFLFSLLIAGILKKKNKEVKKIDV